MTNQGLLEQHFNRSGPHVTAYKRLLSVPAWLVKEPGTVGWTVVTWYWKRWPLYVHQQQESTFGLQ